MQRLRTLHLFAGAGGGLLADVLLGHQPVCAVEIDEYCQQVLSARQEDGCFPWFPIFEDVQAFDGNPWRGIVDIVAGGFPCQDIAIGGKGAGLDGERSGMWSHMARIIGEVRPRYAFIENSPALVSRGLDRVLADLASLGFDAGWGVFSGKQAGAPIERKRIFIACSNKEYGEAGVGDFKRQAQVLANSREECPSFWVQATPVSFGVEHGMDSYVDQVSAIGNGQIPIVAATAWKMLGGV